MKVAVGIVACFVLAGAVYMLLLPHLDKWIDKKIEKRKKK